jgi:hypothetical protein
MPEAELLRASDDELLVVSEDKRTVRKLAGLEGKELIALGEPAHLSALTCLSPLPACRYPVNIANVKGT